ncbi:unnamed protein product [Dovyalis caffra]|uniref:AB hydrolase-1 domain-containing protein n=1 Tax=Dovyalis caffra TaxID=77055 RepID=A0AAV1SER4_9ROSI|nr:unnamed protein product [Dovyalis caffra]
MEKIEHTTISTNGINMHIASIGTGPVILFLHGFPDLWYSWRHQLLSVSSLGYRCIAPDLRGYGDTEVPKNPREYTVFHIVGDLVGLIDSLGIDKVFLVGHDWGAMVAWHFCLFRPDRIKALEPGEVEEDFAQMDTARIIRRFLTSRNPKPPCVPKEVGFRGLPDNPNLPSWLSEKDINYYADKFNQTGFTGGLNYYRCLDLNWELMAAWTGLQIKVPVKFIVGDLDITYHMPGVQDYINKGGLKNMSPSCKK